MACPYASSGSPKPADHPGKGDAVHEEPIPQPAPSWFAGNFPEMDPNFPARTYWRLNELYGPIFKLDLVIPNYVVASQKLVNQVCSQEDKFSKGVHRTLQEVRALTGDGLFTAAAVDQPGLAREENWWRAHRLLVPAFGPLGLRKMFPDMLDISSQMALRWDRLGPDHVIDCSDDFTRLAFDTIGLCAFGYRFNEFYSDDVHPFAGQMSNVLRISGKRASRTAVENSLHVWEERSRQDDVKKMMDLVQQIIAERKKNPQPDAKDLLNTMLHGVDRETGETLSDQNIAYNMVTFLVAGHETTSGTLSFMWYGLMQNPDAFHKAQQQVDEVVGDGVLTVDMLPKLTYIDACIKEALRLYSPIPTTTLRVRQDAYLDNKYAIKEGGQIVFNLRGLHRDPEVWGEDRNEFRPDRFLNGGFQALPPNSWKPFGNGMRSCIGRFFAEQEMIINTALLLQKFTAEMADPGYELEMKATLTIKPTGFFMKMRRRPGKSLLTGIPGGGRSAEIAKQHATELGDKPATAGVTTGNQTVQIFFGGNSGTCEGYAQTLEAKLEDVRIQSTIKTLDAATEHLSKDAANIIITASYEGKPADNAKKFVAWLESLKDEDQLKGVKFAVLGAGNSDWATTFHRIPKLVDERLNRLGATPLVPSAYCNVKTDVMGPFEDWSDALVKALSSNSANATGPEKPALKVTLDRTKVARDLADEKMGTGCVLSNKELADTSVGPSKRHMEIRLPEGMTYDAGDYIVIQPKNPAEIVSRVMRFFGISDHTTMAVEGSRKKFLPSTSTLVLVFLYGHVELATPVTKGQLKILTGYAKGPEAQHLNSLAEDQAFQSLLSKRYSIIDVLEEHPVDLPFDVYIDMLAPLTPRQYSISSSPLAPGYADVATITYDVNSAPALSGHGVFEGVASTFLASRKPGDQIACFVRPTNVGFHLPANSETPIMMFATGTGIAPMRAFLQQRAAISEVGARKLGPAMLFFGCRDPESDFLYKDELKEWEEKGIVTVYAAHSRSEDPNTPKYVQDAIWAQRKDIAELFRAGGKIYLCGSAARLGKSSAEVCKKIWMEYHGKGEQEAGEWLESVKTDRYISDVY